MIVVELACLFRPCDVVVVSVITHSLPLHAITDIRIIPTMRSRTSMRFLPLDVTVSRQRVTMLLCQSKPFHFKPGCKLIGRCIEFTQQ